MDLKLKDKIALVSGASSGLGYATAKLLLQEGARVAINSRGGEKLEQAAASLRAETGGDVLALPADVTAHDAAGKLIAEVAAQFGGLDILIANAGGPPAGKFESFDDEAWQKAVELSFLSQVRLIRAALPLLRKSSAASVLTITSLSVKQPIPNLILSNSIRLATIGLTKALALEMGGEGIRFNSILPAWTETGRVVSLMDSRAKAAGTTPEIEREKQASESPFKRMATPEEFANAAVFLVSPAASYLTGVMLPVDGGMYKAVF